MKSAGTIRSSGPSSWMLDLPRPSSASSIPLRRTDSTFTTPASPFAAAALAKRVTPGRGRWGRALVATAIGAAVATTVADRLAEHGTEIEDGDDAKVKRWARKVARVGGPVALSTGVLASGAFVTGTSAQDADDRFIYNQATGELWFDADGNGAGAQVQFAFLAPATALVASDIVVI